MNANDPNSLNDIIASIKVPVDDPSFHQRVFTLVAKNRKALKTKDLDNLEKICTEEYDDLSRRLDRTKIQDSVSVRNVLRTRHLANLLIDEKGELNPAYLAKVLTCFKKRIYSLGPNRQYDAARQEQIVRVLTMLKDNKDMQRYLKNVSKPYSNRYAEQVIKDTLKIHDNTLVNDPHAKRATLSAWMCYLRQNVGSCFGTAPAIIVHDEQPDLMFKDMIELLGTGRMKRTFGGIEHSVPFSSSWGAGDLRRLFVLQRGPNAESNDIWLSPGIIAGLEAAGVVNSELTLKERVEETKQAILAMLQNWPDNAASVVISAEDILRKCTLRHLNITEKDLQDYENRPKAMFTGSLMMQAQAAGGGKTQAVQSFYTKFNQAMDAFKALADNALLKTWEFTVASFSETKSQFTSWNLYSSLGLGPQEQGGIGQALFRILQEKVERANQKVQEFQIEYEQAYHHLKYLEVKARNAATEKEMQWVKIEYQTARNEFDIMEEMRDKYHSRAHRFANLFDVIVDVYLGLFPKYFQEVYDADMHEVAAGPYDDSPAGFRLLYKHGRSNTSQWTRIKDHNEFIDALASFFVSSESEVAGAPQMQGLENEISEIITAIVMHIRTREFLETAFYRMAKAHNAPIIRDPLENLERVEKKPWVYTSGGTMDTLVSAYWKREQKPTEVGRWVENPTELLVFLVDTFKQVPHKLMEEFDANPQKSMLIHSPTHAFLLKPGYSPLREAWHTDEFTYTYVRDKMIKPVEKMIENIVLDDAMTQYLVSHLADKVDPNFQFYFKQVFNYVAPGMSPIEFRQHIAETMQKERGLGYGRGNVLPIDDIDSLLQSSLPLFHIEELRQRVEAILAKLPGLEKGMLAKFSGIWEQFSSGGTGASVMSAKGLQDVVKAVLILLWNDTSTSYDYHWHVAEAARKLGYALPIPVIFADTNWVRDNFAFLVSPGTGKLELWRVDYTGTVGYPMSMWEQWLDGSRRDRTWGVYTRPYEYSR